MPRADSPWLFRGRPSGPQASRGIQLAKFLIRRLLSYLLLIFLASSIAYLLAATTLSPRSYFQQQQPPPSDQAIEQQLDKLNLNDETPLAERYVTWVSDVATGDFGQTITNDSVNEGVARKAGEIGRAHV